MQDPTDEVFTSIPMEYLINGLIVCVTVRLKAVKCTWYQPAAAENPALPPPSPEDEKLPAAKKTRLEEPNSISTSDSVTPAVTSSPSAAASRAPPRSWRAEEDAKLTKAVQMLGEDWVEVATMVPGRTNKQCSQHWIHVVNRRRRKANGSGKQIWQRLGRSCCDGSQLTEYSVSCTRDQHSGYCQGGQAW
jgi:hypothetical protein